MDSILFLIAQFLTPAAQGLDVLPYLGKPEEYKFQHPVGVVLIRMEENRLVVDLPFRAAPGRLAAWYLESIRGALDGKVITEDGRSLRLTFERHKYLSFDHKNKTDYHASVYQVEAGAAGDFPDPPAPSPTDTVAAAETAILPREDAAGEDA